MEEGFPWLSADRISSISCFYPTEPSFPMLPPWLDSSQPCAPRVPGLEEEGLEMKSLQDAEGKQAAQGAAPEVTSSCAFLWESAL